MYQQELGGGEGEQKMKQNNSVNIIILRVMPFISG